MFYTVDSQNVPIIRTGRKNSIALKVKALGVVIMVPKSYSEKSIMALLKSHGAWLCKTLKRLELRHTALNSHSVFTGLSGQKFEFFGVSKILKVVLTETESEFEPVLVLDKDIRVTHLPEYLKTTKADESIVQVQTCLQLQKFMLKQAYNYLQPKLKFYALKIGVSPKSLTIKSYKSRWGSCYPDGRIQFNWRLMQAPDWVIDYVVVHELCHLVHANHSKDFWQLVSSNYAQMAQAKAHIKKHGARWIQLLAT